MSGQFTVDTDALGKVAGQILANAQEYDSIANKLLQAARDVSSAYQSEDANVYLAQIESCHKDLKAMVQKLNIVSQTLGQQNANYVKVSTHNAEQARKLGSN